MSKVLIILGIILTLAGAGFSYVNYTNEQKLKTDLDTETKAKEAKIAELAKTNDELTATKGTLAETQTNLDTKTSELTATTGKLDAANADLASTKEKLASAEAVVVEKTAKVEELQAQVDKSAELAAQLAQLTTDLNQARTDLATAIAERDAEREKYAKLAATTPQPGAPSEPGRTGVPVIPGITGKVQAVNAGWSFVVLNLGEKDGVVPNAVLDVYRNSTKVGQVKVSSVEPTISTANILETKGGTAATIEPGDRVVTRS